MPTSEGTLSTPATVKVTVILSFFTVVPTSGSVANHAPWRIVAFDGLQRQGRLESPLLQRNLRVGSRETDDLRHRGFATRPCSFTRSVTLPPFLSFVPLTGSWAKTKPSSTESFRLRSCGSP